jgi:hypothetical protein
VRAIFHVSIAIGKKQKRQTPGKTDLVHRRFCMDIFGLQLCPQKRFEFGPRGHDEKRRH